MTVPSIKKEFMTDLVKMEKDLKPLKPGNILGRIAREIGEGWDKLIHKFRGHEWISKEQKAINKFENNLLNLKNEYKMLANYVERNEQDFNVVDGFLSFNEDLKKQLETMQRICKYVGEKKSKEVNKDALSRVVNDIGKWIDTCKEGSDSVYRLFVAESEKVEKTPERKPQGLQKKTGVPTKHVHFADQLPEVSHKGKTSLDDFADLNLFDLLEEEVVSEKTEGKTGLEEFETENPFAALEIEEVPEKEEKKGVRPEDKKLKKHEREEQKISSKESKVEIPQSKTESKKFEKKPFEGLEEVSEREEEEIPLQRKTASEKAAEKIEKERVPAKEEKQIKQEQKAASPIQEKHKDEVKSQPKVEIKPQQPKGAVKARDESSDNLQEEIGSKRITGRNIYDILGEEENETIEEREIPETLPKSKAAKPQPEPFIIPSSPSKKTVKHEKIPVEKKSFETEPKIAAQPEEPEELAQKVTREEEIPGLKNKLSKGLEEREERLAERKEKLAEEAMQHRAAAGEKIQHREAERLKTQREAAEKEKIASGKEWLEEGGFTPVKSKKELEAEKKQMRKKEADSGIEKTKEVKKPAPLVKTKPTTSAKPLAEPKTSTKVSSGYSYQQAALGEEAIKTFKELHEKLKKAAFEETKPTTEEFKLYSQSLNTLLSNVDKNKNYKKLVDEGNDLIEILYGELGQEVPSKVAEQLKKFDVLKEIKAPSKGETKQTKPTFDVRTGEETHPLKLEESEIDRLKKFEDAAPQARRKLEDLTEELRNLNMDPTILKGFIGDIEKTINHAFKAKNPRLLIELKGIIAGMHDTAKARDRTPAVNAEIDEIIESLS